VHGRLVLVQHPEHLVALGHDGHIAEDFRSGVRRARLGRRPADQRVDLADIVGDQAGDDVFLGLEVVIERGLGDVKPLGDLAQRRLLVPLLGKQLDCHLLDARAGIGAACRFTAVVLGRDGGRPGRHDHHAPLRQAR
jgi:hypothetical protein